MEVFYYVVFGVLGIVVATLELSKNNKDRINTSSAFTSFKNNYLVVYSLMMGTILNIRSDLVEIMCLGGRFRSVFVVVFFSCLLAKYCLFRKEFWNFMVLNCFTWLVEKVTED